MEKIVESLTEYERRVLLVLNIVNDLSSIASQSGLQEVEAMRGLQWLANKGIVTLDEDVSEEITLGKNGERYKSEGLPEKRFLGAVSIDTPLSEISQVAKLEKDELNACIGVLKSKAAIEIKKEKELLITITDAGKKILSKESLEEQFLARSFPIKITDLNDEEKFSLENLKKRKDLVRIDSRSSKSANLTDLGKKLIKQDLGKALVDKLTPQMLKDGTYRDQKLRRFDVSINVPKKFGGRKQHYRSFLDDVRTKFLSLGFSEMFGPLVETEFWDMDALFMPQDHSARDIHSAYYIEKPTHGEIDPEILKKVKDSHEKGKGTISKGWGYQFDENKTRQLIMRTQGTALSARMLSSDVKIPGKYFAIARCFRPDVVDATHAADFNQVEGIVIEEDLTFTHLKGLLKMFAEEFAESDQVKIKPAYFPFTEPSAELFAKHPDLGWIELGGSGIFRPELVKPLLGKDISVLAWGLGIDRIAMFKLGINDIRDLMSHDLDKLRSARVI